MMSAAAGAHGVQLVALGFGAHYKYTIYIYIHFVVEIKLILMQMDCFVSLSQVVICIYVERGTVGRRYCRDTDTDFWVTCG
jgi:hypothetical protein